MEESDILALASKRAIDPKSILETLKDTTVRNFRTLYNIQRVNCGVRRYDININDMGRIEKLRTEKTTRYYPRRYGYSLCEPSVFVSSWKKCRDYGLYGIPLSQDTISENSHIFSNNFLMFIDGKMITTGEMIIKDCECIIILDVNAGTENTADGIPEADYVKYCENNETVTIFILPNFKAIGLKLGYTRFDQVLERSVPYSRWGLDSLDFKHTLVFMNTNNDYSTTYHIPAMFDDENKTVDIPKDIPVAANNVYICLLTLSDIWYDTKTVDTEDTKWFQLNEGYNTPFVATNMLAFTENGDGTLSFNKEASLELYYPTFYHTENVPTDTVSKLYLLYKYTNDSKYVNELKLLERLKKDILSYYQDGSLPDFVKDYEPSDHKWIIPNEYVDCTHYPSRPLYNFEALAGMVYKDNNVLMKYLLNKLRYIPKFYVYVERLDLTKRTRMNTWKECDKMGEMMEFPHPYYLISLRNSFIGGYDMDFRIWVDNKFLHPNEYVLIKTMDFYHFYFPVEKITKTSIIEFERHREYEFIVEHTFESMEDDFEIVFPKECPFIFAHDIVTIDMSNNVYIDNSQYRIVSYSDLMEREIEYVPDHYSIIRYKCRIKLLDRRMLNTPIRFHIYHKAVSHLLTNEDGITESGVPATIHTPNYNHPTKREVRMFHNGNYLPQACFGLYDNDRYLQMMEVWMFFRADVDLEKYHTISIDFMPVEYIKEFELDYIDNEYGYVDTGNSLSMPLSLRWYDIYVNGLKLNKSNVDIVTSNKFFIQGIASRKNLEIIRRADAYCEFDFSHGDMIENQIMDNWDQIYEDIIEDKDVLDDVLDDITDDFLKDVADHVEFVKEFLEWTFINPNTQQITEEIMEYFPQFMDEHDCFIMHTNLYPDADWVTMINSNIRSDFMKQGQYRYGWTPLYLGNHFDAHLGEYLCDPVTGSPGMKNQDGTVVPIGIIERLNIHKKTFKEALVNANVGYMDIYYLEPDDNTQAKELEKGMNMLDSIFEIYGARSFIAISADVDVLTKGTADVLTRTDYNPNVNVVYTVDASGKPITETIPLVSLKNHVFNVKANALVVINSISLQPENAIDDLSLFKLILHSILVAY